MTARGPACVLAVVMAVSLAAPAAADLGEYGSAVGHKALVGINGILTFPADPVMSTVRPPEDFREMPGGVVLQYPVGLLQGTVLGVWRLTTGIFDLAFFWFSGMQIVSPDVRYSVFPDLEHEQ